MEYTDKDFEGTEWRFQPFDSLDTKDKLYEDALRQGLDRYLVDENGQLVPTSTVKRYLANQGHKVIDTSDLYYNYRGKTTWGALFGNQRVDPVRRAWSKESHPYMDAFRDGQDAAAELTAMLNPAGRAYIAIRNLTGDNGVHKTYDLFHNGRYARGSLSALGDVLDLTMAGEGLTSSMRGLGNEFRHAVKTANLADGITERFLRFVGSDGITAKPAVPRTPALAQLYTMLKSRGVDMSRVSIEDINKALKLREDALMRSGLHFSYIQPENANSEIIWSIDNGAKTGYIDLKMPYKTNDFGFSPECWEIYAADPKNKGLRINMVKNMTLTGKYPTIQKGLQERLTNSAIEVAKQQGYDGVVSGEVLLSPEATTRMYPKYTDKRLLSTKGIYHWEIHNPYMTDLPGEIYMLETPTYPTKVKSLVFDPTIIDETGHMRINWGTGSTMFNSILGPIIGGTILGKSIQRD